MKTVIIKPSYAEALDEIVARLNKRVPSLDERHVLIVPDIYTFALEKRLFLGGKGAFDLEVTTFNRMYKRLEPQKKALSKQGAIMLIKRLCLENADKLTCYARSSAKSGFAVKLYDAINKLRSCSVLPNELEKAERVHKISDIALLYREYLKATDGRYVDAGGRISLLRELVKKGGVAEDCHYYIALYDTYTKEAQLLIDELASRALSLTVAYVSGPTSYALSAPVTVQGCADRVSQYKMAARWIKEYIVNNEGARYGDICLVDCTQDKSVPRRVLSEYGIPYYSGEKLALNETELSRFIFCALESKRKGFRTDGMLTLAANYYSGVSKRESDAFAGYVRKHCIDYLAFTKPFEYESDDREIAESVRKRLMYLLSHLGKTETAEEFFGGVSAMLEECDAKKRTDELAKADGRELSAVYDKAMELISLASELYGSARVSAEELSATLYEGFCGTEISLVPNENDTVQIGPLSQFRGQRIKLAVIVEFNEGTLPVITVDDGLLTDSDADKLDKYKVTFAPKAEEMNELCRAELWHLLHASEKVLITYSEASGDKPSYELRRLCGVNGVAMKTGEDYFGSLVECTDPKRIAASLGSRAGAMEAALTGEFLPYRSSVIEAVGKENLPSFSAPKPFSDKAMEIFKVETTSVSALQEYFTCPFRYFMSKSLEIKPSDDGTVTPIDVGRLIHKIIERYVSSGMPSNIEEFVESVTPEVLSEYEKYRYSANEEIFGRLRRQAITLCIVVKAQMESGSFVPYGTECSFGKEDSKLKTIEFDGVRLIGDVDRVDLYGDYARIIDYKTGNTAFSYNDLYFGRKIQLIAYLGILLENGYKPAGAFYFPCATEWNEDEYSHRLRGPFNRDERVVIAMDNEMEYGGASSVINASATVNKENRLSFSAKTAVTEGELRRMAEYVNRLIDGAVREIKSGSIAPMPVVTDKKSACEYCDFRAVCGAEKRERSCKGAGLSEIVAAVSGEEE